MKKWFVCLQVVGLVLGFRSLAGAEGRTAVEIDRQDFFPDRVRHQHQSDAILRDAKSDVRYIGEVENHPVR